MAVNKIQISGGEVLLDLTGDTVTAADLRAGVTAHNNAGEEIVGTNAGGGGLNVAYGESPPTDTSKLWIYGTTPPSKIIACQNPQGVFGLLGVETKTATIYPSGLYAACCATVGTDIYIFGGYSTESSTNHQNMIQRYDSLTDERAIMAETLRYRLAYVSCASVGTDVYIFGGYRWTSSTSRGYIGLIQKYDSLTDTITSPSSLNVPMSGTCCAAVGTDIYIFGGVGGSNTSSTYYNYIQKYDTLTNSRTTMSATLPEAIAYASCAAVGTDIYIFGGNSAGTYKNTIQKYSTLTDTIITLEETLPYSSQSTSCAAVGTDIYIFGVSNNQIYRYDTLTNTIILESATLGSSFSQKCCAPVGTSIYTFGVDSNKIQEVKTELDLTENTLLLTTKYNGREVTLISSENTEISFGINNAYIGNSYGIAQYADVYVNNGSVWVNVNTGSEFET